MKNKPRLLLVRASCLPGRWEVKVLDTGLEKMAAAGRIIREYALHVIGMSALFLGLTRGLMSLGRPDEKMDPPPGSGSL